MQGRCPPGLMRSTAAYRFGGFGTHEVVVYYDFIRFLIDAIRESPDADLARLEELRDAWLEEPNREFSGHIPRRIIEHERRRIPEAMKPGECIIDCDCPLCNMMSEMPGVMFWHLDGCNMDEGFAFSFHRTRAEYDTEQREYEESSRRYREREAERKRLGTPDDEGLPWGSSFAAPATAQTPPTLLLFGIGANLAELIGRLKRPVEDRAAIDRLNRDFGNLGDVVRSADPDSGAALLQPVVDRFCEALDAVAQDHPDLEKQCDDLRSRLRAAFGTD